jgi:hypothetical protein
MDPVLGRKVVERQQLLDVVGDLGDRLRKLRTIGRLERLDRESTANTAWVDSVSETWRSPRCSGRGAATRTTMPPAAW